MASFARRCSRKAVGAAFFVVVTVVTFGCQRSSDWNLTPVEGTVTRDGRPLTDVQIIFWPEADTKAPRTSGFTDDSGRYRLQVDSGQNGAARGRYRVCILDRRRDAAVEESRGRKLGSKRGRNRKIATASAQPQQKADSVEDSNDLKPYGEFEKTPLRAEVKPGGPQTIDFNIP